MSPVRRIVVGTDFSPDAHRAVAYAGELAKALNACLTVVHVDAAARFIPGSNLAETEARADRTRMDVVVRELCARDVDASGCTVPGLPSEGLCEAARAQGADLVVVGSVGRSCFANVMLGSVAERVIRDAPCPVLVTRNP
jgi:nucleotide-binding universal stress UspA family protein